MSGGVRLHRHRPERARDCSKNPARPSALPARSVFPAAWAGQRNLRSSRTRDFKSSASTVVVSVGMREKIVAGYRFVMSSEVETSLDISGNLIEQIKPAGIQSLD